MTVSTQIKKLDGEEQMAEGDEEPDASMFLGEDQKEGTPSIVNELASDAGFAALSKRSE